MYSIYQLDIERLRDELAVFRAAQSSGVQGFIVRE